MAEITIVICDPCGIDRQRPAVNRYKITNEHNKKSTKLDVCAKHDKVMRMLGMHPAGSFECSCGRNFDTKRGLSRHANAAKHKGRKE